MFSLAQKRDMLLRNEKGFISYRNFACKIISNLLCKYIEIFTCLAFGEMCKKHIVKNSQSY